VIRKNFIDGTLYTTFDPSPTTYEPLRVPYPFPSPFIVNTNGTGISGTIGTFQGKRPHYRNSLDMGGYNLTSDNDLQEKSVNTKEGECV